MPSHIKHGSVGQALSPANRIAAAAILFLMTIAAHAATLTYHIAGDDPGAWPQILGSIGLSAAAGGPANLVVVRNVAPGSVPQWLQRIEQGEMVVLEGESDLAQALGFEAGKKHVVVRSMVDQHAPKLPIVWKTGVDIPVFAVPADARIFA